MSDSSSSQKYEIAFYAPEEKVESVFIDRKGYQVEQAAYYQKTFAEKYGIPEE